MPDNQPPAGPVFAAIYRQHLRQAVINKYGHDLYLCLKHLWNLGFRGAELRLSGRLPASRPEIFQVSPPAQPLSKEELAEGTRVLRAEAAEWGRAALLDAMEERRSRAPISSLPDTKGGG